MKAVYLKNFRRGFATNSSSTHSVIYRNKEDLFNDLNIFELDYYDRFDNTIAASKEAKIKYVAANIKWNEKLFEVMCAFYPEMKQYEELAKNSRDDDNYNTFGMYSRGELYFANNANLEASIDYLRNIIDNEEIIIIGGSDETDFVYDTKDGHTELPMPADLRYSNDSIMKAYKNGNYWVGYGYNGRLRFKTDRDECIPEYPELVDLRITNRCQHACPWCFMDSTMKEKDADFNSLKYIIGKLSGSFDIPNARRIEFSVGGGNILLYPHLDNLFKFMKDKGHIINTTINSKDCKTLLSDEKLLSIFNNYVSAVGISVTDKDDFETLEEFKEVFKKNDKKLVIHLIPELLGIDKTLNIIEELNRIGYYNFLFLGYKTNGRGSSQSHRIFKDYELSFLFKHDYMFSIDTTFANTYSEWLDKNFHTEYTITKNEGEYSMYIDGVKEIAYKSSYQLDKPYPLKYTTYNAHGTEWFTPIEAFSNIRKDNGFKVYGEESTESN